MKPSERIKEYAENNSVNELDKIRAYIGAILGHLDEEWEKNHDEFGWKDE